MSNPDIFSSRRMLRSLEQAYAPVTFLTNTYFGSTEPADGEYVDIDIIKGKRRMAPFVSPKMEGKVVQRVGFATYSYKPPYIKEKMVSTAQDFLKRQAGETIYQSNDGPAQRAAKQVGKDLAEMDDLIIRRIEWMCASLLNDGTLTIVGDGISMSVDFLMPSTHKITISSGTLKWSDRTNSKPYENLKTWRRLIMKDSGITPDTVIMGQDVVENFINNADIRARMDLLRADWGRIAPQALPNGVTWLGFFPELGLTLYSYDAWYDDDSGVSQSYVPVNKIWMGSTRARTAVHYGAIQDLQAGGNFAVPRFPKSWETEDPSARWIMLQSAPLPALHQSDAFVSVVVQD